MTDPNFPEAIEGSERRILLTLMGASIGHLIEAGMTPESIAAVAYQIAADTKAALAIAGINTATPASRVAVANIPTP
jgi:hypothetical protein